MLEALHKDWLWLDAEKDVDFSPFASVHSVPHVTFPA